VGTRTGNKTAILALATGLVTACSGGGHKATPPGSTTTTTTTVPAGSTTTATTAPATTTTTRPKLLGQAVSIGSRQYTATLTGPVLTTQMGSRSVPPGQGIVTFVLTVGNPTSAPISVTPFDTNGSPTDVHLLGPAGDPDFTCRSPSPFPGRCDVTGIQIEDDSAADAGSRTIAPGHLASIVYEVSNVVPSNIALSTLEVVLVTGGPAPGYVQVMTKH
jgi:hypothetical protein